MATETMTTEELKAKRDQAHAAFEKASRESGYRADLDHAKAYWHHRWVDAVMAEREANACTRCGGELKAARGEASVCVSCDSVHFGQVA